MVYVATSIRPELVRLNKIKPFDKLFSIKSDFTVVDVIEQSVKPTTLYQIILENRTGDVYADNILVHVGFELPAYFRNHHVDCRPGTTYFKKCSNINIKTLPATLSALGIMFVGLMIIDKAVGKILNR